MKWNSIRTKLIVFLLLPTILVVGATMLISYSYTTQSLRSRAVDENRNLLFQGAQNLGSLLKEINRLSLTVYSDSEFYRLIEAGYEDMTADVRIYASLNYIATAMPDIAQVYLYGVKDSKSTLITYNTPKRWQGTPPFEASRIEEGEPLIVQSTHLSHSYGLTAPNPQSAIEPVFTVHRRIEKVPSPRPIGYLSIDVRLSALASIVDQLVEQEQERIYLLDETGQLVYTNRPDAYGGRLTADWYKDRIQASETDDGDFEQDKAVFVYQKVPAPGASWTLVKQIPVPYLLREANEAVTINLLLLALLLVLIVTIIILISLRITAPIKRLTRYMNQVQTGKLDIDIVPGGKDEIGIVTERFRSMMDTINNLILREYKLELANRTNELRALQSQINPHFLNNTLQIIGTLALELKVPQIYALLSALAKMMHYSMHNDEKVVTVQDELDHVKAYVELQKERYEGRFAYFAEVDPALLDKAMPKMILQPIVENYFKHGFERSESGGRIELTAHPLDEGRMEIVIRNNGSSIPERRLALLNAELERPGELDLGAIREDHGLRDAPGSGIGLANVLARMKLVSGASASLTVDNLPEGGVAVRLEFEIRTEGELA